MKILNTELHRGYTEFHRVLGIDGTTKAQRTLKREKIKVKNEKRRVSHKLSAC